MSASPGFALKDGSISSEEYPSLRDGWFKDSLQWLQGKAQDDGAAGLWRVHDKLYDLGDFISRHPGGETWLRMTKGTDITELFESHHLSELPEALLEEFYVRQASSKRSSPFTFHSDGFYKLLKKKVRLELENLPRGLEEQSHFVMDVLTFSTFFVSVLGLHTSSVTLRILLVVLAGVLLGMTTICAHNYIHKRDNWRRFCFNLGFFSAWEWRITHVLSHHMFPNTLLDYEVSALEPIFYFLPYQDKSLWNRFGPWLYFPIIYLGIWVGQLFKRLTNMRRVSRVVGLPAEELVPLLLPCCMLLLGAESSLLISLLVYLLIVCVGSFTFTFIGFSVGHHHPETYHYGDEVRKDYDWGLHQLDVLVDREDTRKSLWLGLTHFGDHTLHHLFPTLDHAVLSFLYPIVMQTCEEFGAKVRSTASAMEAVTGQFQQMARITPRRTKHIN